MRLRRIHLLSKMTLLALICTSTAQSGRATDNTEMLEETVPKYLETLEFKIKQQWFPPKISKFKTAIVRFQLHRDGSLSDLFLERSSGQKLLDQAAIRAIRNVSPVSGIPEGCPQALKLRFRFDYYDAAVLADPKRRARKHLELLGSQAKRSRVGFNVGLSPMLSDVFGNFDCRVYDPPLMTFMGASDIRESVEGPPGYSGGSDLWGTYRINSPCAVRHA